MIKLCMSVLGGGGGHIFNYEFHHTVSYCQLKVGLMCVSMGVGVMS